MDPNATLGRLSDAFDTNDFDEIEEAAKDLLAWINKSDQDSYLVQAPHLVALLLMAHNYARGL